MMRRGAMVYVRVGVYDVPADDFPEVVRRAEEGLAPLYESTAGYLSYGMLLAEDGTLVSISTWETEAAANLAAEAAAEWVLANLDELVVRRTHHVGHLVAVGSVATAAFSDRLPRAGR